MPLISFDGICLPLEEVQNNPARFALHLERAKKSPGYAVCGCKPSSIATPLRLVIRRYGKLFHLARWPDEGAKHDAATCPFFAKPGPIVESAGPAQDAIRNTPDGLNAKLDISLSVRTVDRVQPSGESSRTRTAGRRSAPLLGFLQRIWGDAGLNQWSGGGQRNWGACNAQVLAQLGEGKLNGRPMQEVLHVMRRYEETQQAAIKAEFEDFLARIQTTAEASERGIVIAEIKSIDQSKYSFVVKLRQTVETFFAPKDVIEKAAKSFRYAWSMIGNSDARVIAVLVLERTRDDNLRVIDLALQLCNKAFIPCDSSYEVAMANRLVAENRRFRKPIRLSPGDDMLPDFVLTDTGTETSIEVYGMESHDAYRLRKAQKQLLYAKRGTPCVEWVPPADLASVRFPRVA
jgi:Protein of unknown function (DUF1173)